MKMIKSIGLLFTLALVFTSCEKIDKLTQFEMDYKQSVTVPATTIIDIPFSVTTPEIESNAETTFSGYNTRTDLIEKIALNVSPCINPV